MMAPDRRPTLEHAAPECVDADAPARYPRRRYPPIEDHSVIGNLRTAALVSTDGVIDSLCWPNFDSPSVFASLLDADIGGEWSIRPVDMMVSKQHCASVLAVSRRLTADLPNSCVVSTKFLSETAVVTVTDYLPRPSGARTELLPWVVRRVEGVRGTGRMRMECLPAFDYARDAHTTAITPATENGGVWRAIFTSSTLRMELLAVVESDETTGDPAFELQDDTSKTIFPRALGSAAFAEFDLAEGQIVTFVLRECPREIDASSVLAVSAKLLSSVLRETVTYVRRSQSAILTPQWTTWIHKVRLSLPTATDAHDAL